MAGGCVIAVVGGAGVFGAGVCVAEFAAASPESEPHEALLQKARAEMDQVSKEVVGKRRVLFMRE
jgi:hypothetical protein